MFGDADAYVGYLGRDINLVNNAHSPFYSPEPGRGLTRLTVGTKVRTVPEMAFKFNSNLCEVTIANGLTAIPEEAFYRCDPLQGIEIPSSVETIGKNAFAGDSCMTSLIFNEGIKFIDYQAFNNCKKVPSIALPASLDTIQCEAFRGVTGMTSVTIADSNRPLIIKGYRYYGHGVFYDSSNNIHEVYLGRNIGLTDNALSPFIDMASIVKVELGAPVDSLADKLFYGCSAIEHIISNPIVPPLCPGNAWASVNRNTAHLFVPFGTKEFYQNALEWSTFFNIIEFGNVVVEGDVDGNGTLEVNDVVILAEVAMGGSSDGVNLSIADMDGNGVVDVNDVVMLAGIVIGN